MSQPATVSKRVETAAEDRLITAKELARQLGIRVRTLYRWIHEGKAPTPIRFSTRTLRWRLSSVHEFMAALPERLREPDRKPA